MTQLALELLGMAFTAGAIYGAIRADLKSTRERAEAAHLRADEAHERIDAVLLKGR